MSKVEISFDIGLKNELINKNTFIFSDGSEVIIDLNTGEHYEGNVTGVDVKNLQIFGLKDKTLPEHAQHYWIGFDYIKNFSFKD